MLKLLSSLFIIISLSSCGVDTSSSSQDNTISNDTSNDTSNESDSIYNVNPIIDLNPIVDANSTVPGSGTNPDDGQGTGGGTTPPTNDANQGDSIFDISGAVEDPFACKVGDSNQGFTENMIKDDSYDYLGEIDEEFGLGITSRYAFNSDVSKTEVALYYYDLVLPRASIVSLVEDDYTVSVDTAWAQNDNSVLYVRTPKDRNDLFACYRYDLKSLDIDGQAEVTKVYRLNEK